MKATTCAGNMSQIVIKLDGIIDEVSVQNHLIHFTRRFPVLYGKICRDFIFIPYWQIPERVENNPNFNVYHIKNSSSQENVLSLLKSTVNKPFKNNNEYLAFHLIHTDTEQSYLAMTFDHRLFDARGAEAFLNLFQHYLVENGNSENAEGINFTASAAMFQWLKKLNAGRKVNKRMIALSKIAALPLPNSKTKRGFSFRLISFNQFETDRIYNRAHDEAGYLMEMPYLLSVIICSVHNLFKKRGAITDTYLIPIPIDMRDSEEIFFNHFSFLFFQIHSDDINDSRELIKTIKRQMYEQVQSGFHKDILKVSLLSRIVPLPVLGKIFSFTCKEKLASFCFSYIGKCSYKYPDIMGTEINNLFHMPRIPTPPGLGFFFNYFNGRFNLVISHLDGLINREEIEVLESGIKQRLGISRD